MFEKIQIVFLFAIFLAVLPTNGADFGGGVKLGYYGGRGWQAFATVTDFSSNLPVAVRLGIGYTSTDPGNPLDARRIFINNATNGVPQKKGWTWNFRGDVLIPVKIKYLGSSLLFFGPRYSSFTANFKFIGGNEFFDVISKQWGLGVGLERRFPLGKRFDLLLTVGADYFPDGELTGHDTTYNPDGEDINPREDSVYQDADKAINQPKLEPLLMLGITYWFGK